MKISVILILILVLVTLCLAGTSHQGKRGGKPGSKRHHGHHAGHKKGQLKARSRRGLAETEVGHAVVKKESPEQNINGQDFVLDSADEQQNTVVALDTLGRSGRTFWPFTDWNSYYYSPPRPYHYSRPYYSTGRFGTRRRGWWPAGWANSG